MDACVDAPRLLEQEALALLLRLERIKPFALQETMLPAAAVSVPAQRAIERMLVAGRIQLRGRVRAFLRWLRGPGREAPAEAQRRFGVIRLAFNDVVTQFDLFSDALTQRSEAETGVLLSGLDALAADALVLPDAPLEAPAVVCYLDRGAGAAIRRARTRLPGGARNPVAVVRVPRERMVGVYGLGASIAHEVGHQGAALLGLVPSLRAALAARPEAEDPEERVAWWLWERWISEVVADLWSVARLGVTSTLGLIGVVSLPAFAVWRLNFDDPHPTPWMRVKLSCAVGSALYPHAQWQQLAAVWERLYPRSGLGPRRLAIVDALERTLPRFVELLLSHRPASLGGRELGAALGGEDRRREPLLARFRSWQDRPAEIRRAPPAQAFAVLGQARAAGALTAREEERTLPRLLTLWALRGTLALPPDSPASRLPPVRPAQPVAEPPRLAVHA